MAATAQAWVAGVVLSARVRDEVLLTGLEGFEVGIGQVIEQAALRRADLLAALGELVAFENDDFVSELLDDRFIAMDLSARGVDLGHQPRIQCTQLFGGHLVEIGQGSHGVDFTKAGPQRLHSGQYRLVIRFQLDSVRVNFECGALPHSISIVFPPSGNRTEGSRTLVRPGLCVRSMIWMACR